MPIELWGGVECTVNRVNDCFFDQLERNGHDGRARDLDLFADLGIKKLRYPVLWERVTRSGTADWRWSDERLARMREFGIEPIVGLLHHGSGPAHTSLVDPAFPTKFRSYARQFAERYPWVEHYTPINEPLTTARFSGLYGHWYPHGRDERTFVAGLLNQCRGIIEAMREIRNVNSSARLVQTEDVGKTFSTAVLRYQADFDNARRWLAFDLLCGAVSQQHFLWNFLLDSGAEERDLFWFAENACVPDVIGVNHYLTSQRYLDHEFDAYPAAAVGGNGKHRYADVEAVRVGEVQMAEPEELIAEIWERYRTPIAITEVHLGCSSEEQMRWFRDLWEAAVSARERGADVCAVTAWALLGSYDWNSLVTKDSGYYEPGAFDIRSPEPRATALARMLRQISVNGQCNHPVLEDVGWWKRPGRILYKPVPNQKPVGAKIHSARPILIIGAKGTLGRALVRECALRGLHCRALSRRNLDITSVEDVASTISDSNAWAVINAAGYVRVDLAEIEREECFRVNTTACATIARECACKGIPFVTFSTDLVFDGTKASPYVETDPPRPINVYGMSKAEGERQIFDITENALVIRTAAFFGPSDKYNFVTQALRAIARGNVVLTPPPSTVTPTYVPDLAYATLNLLVDGETGLWHLTNEGETTWPELVRMAAEEAGFRGPEIEFAVQPGTVAPRPFYTALASNRGWLMPSLHHALRRYLVESGIGRELRHVANTIVSGSREQREQKVDRYATT